MIDADRRRLIESEVECEIEVAFAFAELSAEPRPDALYADVVAEPRSASRRSSDPQRLSRAA